MQGSVGGVSWVKSKRVGYARRLCRSQYHDKGLVPNIYYSSPSSVVPSSRVNNKPKGEGGRRANCRELAKKRCGTRDICSTTPIFLQDFLRPEEKWRSKTSSRPLSTQQDAAHPSFQNGDNREDSQERVRAPVGLLGGYNRRLSSCAYSLGVPQVLRIRAWKSDLCLPGSTLRPVSSSMGLLKGDETHQVILARGGSHGFLFPGRLPHSGKLASASAHPHINDNHFIAKTGLCDKLGKVVSPSSSKVGVPRSYAGPSQPHFVASSGQGGESRGELHGLPQQIPYVKKGPGTVGGSVKLCRSLHSLGEIISSAHHSLDELSHIDRVSGPLGSPGLGIERHAGALVGSRLH